MTFLALPPLTSVQFIFTPVAAFDKIACLQHLVRQLVHRVPPLFGCATRVRRAPGHLELHGGDTGRRQANGVLQAGALERQHQIVLRSELGDERPGAGGTDFFITVDQHGDQTVVAEIERLEQWRPYEGRARRRACRPRSRVRTRDHRRSERAASRACPSDTRCPCARAGESSWSRYPESADDRLTSPWRRVLEPHHVGRRIDELDLSAERSETTGYEIGDSIQPLDVRAARLDGHQLAKRFEVRLSLALRAREHRVRGLREYPRGEQRGDRDEDKA